MATVELKVLEGELKGRVLSCDKPGCVLFGRAGDAALRVGDDPFVSRLHFLLVITPPFVLLYDLGSKNGVFINDTSFVGSAPRQPLSRPGSVTPKSVFVGDGDQIVVGRNRILVTILEGPAGASAIRKRTTARRILPFAGIPTASMGEIQPDTFLGPYRIDREIGRGWMGAVYQADDTRSGESVALKTLVPNIVFEEMAAARFVEKARELRDLEHPGVCRQYDLWRDGNIFLCAQDYVDGMDLGQLLTIRGGRLGIEEAVPVMREVLEALAYAHSLILPDGAKGVFHRNLKPRNILVSGHGRGIRARVADFGLYQALEASGLTQMIMSELYFDAAAYWPRERITWFDRSLAASEVFSAAAVFYEMLTGFLPREGVVELRSESRKTGRPPSLADFLRVFAEHPPVPIRERNPDIPPAIAAVIDRALAEPIVQAGEEEPDQVLAAARYPDMDAFRAALLGACAAY